MPAFFDTGFCVRERSWHGLEDLLETPPASIEEARRLAGLEWEPDGCTGRGVQRYSS